eukprot:3157229-Pyramimonas_sp.AAC.1
MPQPSLLAVPLSALLPSLVARGMGIGKGESTEGAGGQEYRGPFAPGYVDVQHYASWASPAVSGQMDALVRRLHELRDFLPGLSKGRQEHIGP